MMVCVALCGMACSSNDEKQEETVQQTSLSVSQQTDLKMSNSDEENVDTNLTLFQMDSFINSIPVKKFDSLHVYPPDEDYNSDTNYYFKGIDLDSSNVRFFSKLFHFKMIVANKLFAPSIWGRFDIDHRFIGIVVPQGGWNCKSAVGILVYDRSKKEIVNVNVDFVLAHSEGDGGVYRYVESYILDYDDDKKLDIVQRTYFTDAGIMGPVDPVEFNKEYDHVSIHPLESHPELTEYAGEKIELLQWSNNRFTSKRMNVIQYARFKSKRQIKN